MNARRLLHGPVALLGAATLAATCYCGPFSYVSESEKLTAVYSKTFNGYERVRAPDGRFSPETYAFGEGEAVSPQLMATADPSIDNLGFKAIARILAKPLAGQNYITGVGPRDTQLLIMVYWGRTTGSYYRNTIDGITIDALDYWNGALMGYNTGQASEVTFEPSMAGFNGPARGTVQRLSRMDLQDDLQVDRYFVILRAYDFQRAWRGRGALPLWETRFSLSERAHAFDEDLPSMARNASLFFGHDSHGMVRIPEVPAGRVDIGDLKVVGEPPSE
jgi:hypothetical protein